MKPDPLIETRLTDQIDRTKHYSLKLLLNIFIYKTHLTLVSLMKIAGKRVGNIGYNRAELTRADLTQADLTRGRVDLHSSHSLLLYKLFFLYILAGAPFRALLAGVQ